MKILVVDDDTAYLESMQDLLQDVGYDVEVCPDSQEALHCLDKHPFGCVLLDYQMPGLDGQDVLRLIHSKHPEVPVIMCSGYLGAKESFFLREGAFEVLTKPMERRVLLDTIRKAVATAEEEVTSIFVTGYNLRRIRESLLRKMVIKALTKTDFNMTHAAALLGISRQCLFRYLKLYHIEH